MERFYPLHNTTEPGDDEDQDTPMLWERIPQPPPPSETPDATFLGFKTCPYTHNNIAVWGKNDDHTHVYKRQHGVACGLACPVIGQCACGRGTNPHIPGIYSGLATSPLVEFFDVEFANVQDMLTRLMALKSTHIQNLCKGAFWSLYNPKVWKHALLTSVTHLSILRDSLYTYVISAPRHNQGPEVGQGTKRLLQMLSERRFVDKSWHLVEAYDDEDEDETQNDITTTPPTTRRPKAQAYMHFRHSIESMMRIVHDLGVYIGDERHTIQQMNSQTNAIAPIIGTFNAVNTVFPFGIDEETSMWNEMYKTSMYTDTYDIKHAQQIAAATRAMVCAGEIVFSYVNAITLLSIIPKFRMCLSGYRNPATMLHYFGPHMTNEDYTDKTLSLARLVESTFEEFFMEYPNKCYRKMQQAILMEPILYFGLQDPTPMDPQNAASYMSPFYMSADALAQQRAVAVAMGTHPRLGHVSILSRLDPNIIQIIMENVYAYRTKFILPRLRGDTGLRFINASTNLAQDTPEITENLLPGTIDLDQPHNFINLPGYEEDEFDTTIYLRLQDPHNIKSRAMLRRVDTKQPHFDTRANLHDRTIAYNHTARPYRSEMSKT